VRMDRGGHVDRVCDSSRLPGKSNVSLRATPSTFGHRRLGRTFSFAVSQRYLQAPWMMLRGSSNSPKLRCGPCCQAPHEDLRVSREPNCLPKSQEPFTGELGDDNYKPAPVSRVGLARGSTGGFTDHSGSGDFRLLRMRDDKHLSWSGAVPIRFPVLGSRFLKPNLSSGLVRPRRLTGLPKTGTLRVAWSPRVASSAGRTGERGRRWDPSPPRKTRIRKRCLTIPWASA